MFCWSALLWPRFTNATSSPRLFWSSIENKLLEGTLTSHLFTKTTILCLPWSLWLPHPWGSWPGLQYQAWLSFEEGLKSNRKANWLPPHQSSLWAPPLFPKNAVKCISLKQTAVWVFLNVCGHLKCIYKNWFEYRESLHPSPNVLQHRGDASHTLTQHHWHCRYWGPDRTTASKLDNVSIATLRPPASCENLSPLAKFSVVAVFVWNVISLRDSLTLGCKNFSKRKTIEFVMMGVRKGCTP